jgi:predicted amidophosphoribosyltransferase
VRCDAPVPRRAILVDDVLTTGATLTACALALRSRGAIEVIAVVFARSPGPVASGLGAAPAAAYH